MHAKGERTPGTCEWVTKDKSYQAWLEGKTEILWICGGPGKGKTMLSIYLTQELERIRLFQYYFCNGQDDKRNNAAAVLRTLIWQVLGSHEEAAQHLARYMNDPSQRQATLTSPGTLWNLFVKIVKDVVAKNDTPITCLIDGIDECDQESTRWLCDKFTDLCYNGRNISLFRVVVISRQVSGLSRASKIELDSSTNRNTTNDVVTFISETVQKLAVERSLTAGVCELIRTMLHDKAEGTFLWVGFVLQELHALGTGVEMLRALDSMPRGLSASYEGILGRIESRGSERSVAILHWVAMADRPLDLDELHAAVECEPQAGEHALDAMRDEIAICAPLLEVRQRSVVFVHQSVIDYLVRAHDAHDPALRKYLINFEDVHFHLARRCLRSLSWNDKLTEYAQNHWLSHAEQLHALAYQLVVQEPLFFGSNSSVRDAWWSKSSWGQLLHSQSPSFYSTSPAIPRLHMACYLGLWAWVDLIFTEEGPALFQHLLRSRNAHRRTPLLCAVDFQRLEVIERLFAYGESPNGAHPGYPNDWYDAPRFFFGPKSRPPSAQHASLSQANKVETPLHYAVRAGLYESANFLLQHGANVNNTIIDQSSVLTIAVATTPIPEPWMSSSRLEKHLAMVSLLLRSGADTNYAGLSTTPLCAAAMSGQEPVARMLLDWGAHPDGTSAEPCVASFGNSGRLSWREGALGGTAQGQNFTAMHLAARNGYADIVQLLAERGANLDPRNSRGETPIMLAVQAGRLDVVRLLPSLGVPPLHRVFIPDAAGGSMTMQHVSKDGQYV